MMANSAIKLNGLTKNYGDLVAVDHISFQVEAGSIFGFMGHNGAGKTTAIRMLLGLVHPTAGQATVYGHNIVDESIAVRAISGYLPGTFTLPGDMTPTTFLTYIASMFGQQGNSVKTKIDSLLQLFDLKDVANKRLKEFSAGMTQKVALAQALINDPKVLFLDEPTSGLDPFGRHDFLEHIKTLAVEKGVTVLFSTHILSDIECVCQNVAILHQGSLIAQGTLSELKEEYGETRMDDLYLKIARRGRA